MSQSANMGFSDSNSRRVAAVHVVVDAAQRRPRLHHVGDRTGGGGGRRHVAHAPRRHAARMAAPTAELSDTAERSTGRPVTSARI